MNKEKIIVVGTNHAGTYAVSTLSTLFNDSVDITTYDSNNNISFLGCGMALWIGGLIKNINGLFYATPESLKQKGINVYMENTVNNIDFKNKSINIIDKNGNNKTDTYDKIIIAVGSWPIKPNIPGIDLENITYAKLFQDAQHVKKIIEDKNIHKITVVGGGYIGIELAEAFAKNNKETTLITDNMVLNRYYDKEFSNEMTKNLLKNNVIIQDNQKVIKFIGDNNNKVSKVVTNKGEYDTDIVLMSVGFKANTEFLKNSNLKMDSKGIILVDDKQQTNIKDVYAIGDCCCIKSNVTKTDKYIALATNAVRTGIISALNTQNLDIPMHGVQGSNAIHIFDLTMTSTGLNSDAAKLEGFDIDSVILTDKIRPDFMPTNNDVTIKIIWDKKTLKILGAQIMSKEDITLAIHMFSLAIDTGYTIDKLATLDLFFLPHFNKPENFITKAGLLALKKVLNY